MGLLLAKAQAWLKKPVIHSVIFSFSSPSQTIVVESPQSPVGPIRLPAQQTIPPSLLESVELATLKKKKKSVELARFSARSDDPSRSALNPSGGGQRSGGRSCGGSLLARPRLRGLGVRRGCEQAGAAWEPGQYSTLHSSFPPNLAIL